MTPIQVLRSNFKETTNEMPVYAIWVVRLVLLLIITASVTIAYGVFSEGAPNIGFW